MLGKWRAYLRGVIRRGLIGGEMRDIHEPAGTDIGRELRIRSSRRHFLGTTMCSLSEPYK